MGIELIPRTRRLRSKMTPVTFRGPLPFESGFHFLVHSWIQTGEIVLELRYPPRSNDRDYWHRLTVQPGECDLRHAAPVCSETDFTAEMIGATRCSSGRKSFNPSMVIRPPSALPSP